MIPVPFYRLRNGSIYLYTLSIEERESAIAQYGFEPEGIAGYLLPTDAPLAGEVAPDVPTLRDTMAIAIMGGLINANVAGRLRAMGGSSASACAAVMAESSAMAEAAYLAADAMLKARGSKY